MAYLTSLVGVPRFAARLVPPGLLVAAAVACGGDDPVGGTDAAADSDVAATDITGDVDVDPSPDDVSTDALLDAGADTAGDAARPDVDVEETDAADVRPADVMDTSADTSDVDLVDAQDTGADAGRTFTPGTLPLPDYIGCDENSDCPNGTGNCITGLVLNRALPDGTNTVPLTEVFSGLTRAGVCSLSCTTSPDACDALGFRADAAAFTCQLVFVGESPYPGDDTEGRPAFPFDDQIVPEQMAAGRAYAALCRPPFERSTSFAPDFCAECSGTLLCLPDSACVSERPATASGATDGTCRIPCDDDAGCPSGFVCDSLDVTTDIVLSGMTEGSFCRPLLDTCGNCRDRDADGRGVGACAGGTSASSVDCDDRAPDTWFAGMDSTHPFPTSCGPDLDANCNGRADEAEQVGSAEFGRFHCSTCGDVCEGAFANASTSLCESSGAGTPGVCRAQCDDPASFVDCDGVRENGCETSVVDPNRLFIPDCDGDGVGALNATPLFDCSNDGAFVYPVEGGTCAAVVAVLNATGGYGSDCDDGDNSISPLETELCDGIDNDCDGITDPSELFALGTPCSTSGAMGVCATTAVRVCNAAGGVTCQAGAPSPELCDNVDNNCDGFIDNFVASTPENGLGASCTAAGALGSCSAGSRVCTAGALTCAPGTPALTDLPRDGVDGSGNPIDADCDGFDGDLDKAIFIRVGGSDTGGTDLGTRTNPVGTLARAFQLYYASAGRRNQFYLAAGDYTVPHMIQIPSDIAGFSMIGGYSVSGTTWTAGSGSTTVQFTGICPCNEATSRTSGSCSLQTCATNQPAISVLGPQNARLEQLAFDVPARPAGSGHLTGLRCQNSGSNRCDGLTLERVAISVEGGAAGTAPAAAPAAGANGTSGAIPSNDALTSGAAGAASACGARGGNGGEALVSTVPPPFCTVAGDTFVVQRGGPGTAGSPSGRGGSAGAGGRPSTATCTSSSVNNFGGNGATVTTGTPATGGTRGTSAAPLTRTAGGNGQAGVSGGGGGGGGGSGQWAFAVPVPVGGAGGASGGCPGSAGAGGAPGWSVFGMWLEDDVAPNLLDFSVTVGPGGAGGAGQAGSAGGMGGVASQHPLGFGGAGGPGGHGTGGSGGGGGGGGWSIGIARRPTVPVTISPTIGAAGAGGLGGAGGPGGTGPISIFGGTPDFVTALAGESGATGAAGGAAQFCNISGGTVAGVPACN